MDQQWFEMLEIRKRRLNDVVWIPLRAAQRDTTGEMGFAGYWEEFSGVGSVGIPLDKKDAAAGLGWRDIGLGYAHRPSVEDGRYTPADVFIDFAHDEDLSGVPFVLSQDGNRNEVQQWHLHQDLVIALRLKRANDVWLAIDEGYIEVARLRRREGSPCLLEIRAEHLKD